MDQKLISEFSINSLYGDIYVFKKRLNQGYYRVTFGQGPWVMRSSEYPGVVADSRILAMYIFYGNGKPIATYEHQKSRNGSKSKKHMPIEQEFENKEEFDKYLKDHQINITESKYLKDVVTKYEETEKWRLAQ